MQKKRWIKVIIFFIILLLLFQNISKILSWSVVNRKKYPRIMEFFDERENSLDAVYIGSSSTFAYWQAPIAWEKYGIAVHSLCSTSQPIEAAKYLIEDARKRQPDALFIIPVNTMYDTCSDVTIHYLADSYPLSWNKMKMIWRLSDFAGFSLPERLEFYVPFLAYHSRWNELDEGDFNYSTVGIKGASIYNDFLERTANVTEQYVVTDEVARQEEYAYDTLIDLMNYCNDNQVKVLFITVPQARGEDKGRNLQKYNAANELIASYGFETLDMMPMLEEIGLDTTTDFYNGNHTNVHGSLKYTLWFGNYLIEKYGFSDKRTDSAYTDWEQESDAYIEIIKPYISEEEYNLIMEK